METLGEDILLLAVRPTGQLAVAPSLRYALSGSELIRLAAARRVDVVKDRIVVLDATPTGEPPVDAALADIVGSLRPPRPKEWVAKDRKGLVAGYQSRLEASGALRRERGKALGLFTVTRWTVLDLARLADARARLDIIVRSFGPVDREQAAFGGLVHAIGLGGVLYPGRDGKAARKRLEEVARRHKTVCAVHSAVHSAGDAAVYASIDSATGASVDASINAAVTASVDAAVSAAVDAAVTASIDAAVSASIDAAVSASVDAASHASSSHGGHDGGAGGGHH